MKLLYSPASPYARKVLALAHERGLTGRITVATAATAPTGAAPDVTPHNPLGKVPALLLDDGTVLYDSRVICEYLDGLGDGPGLFPQGPARWDALTRQALGDGLLDAALLTRYERVLRPEAQRWAAWDAGQVAKITAALDRIEALVPAMPALDIGAVAIACALGYLDFRFPELAWREGRPASAAWYAAFSARPAMAATAPRG
ncbi:glutathione S-transferase [Methylobacterium sp. NEAU 140]|uniref:glutathione S-transferase n=1 Tax=Methylobacterium sp. NEAU 140 TaxID=3064945 RepID=UPI0027327E00|nr:glutathione S-transferase [Methylobacterium sp. NEAU 140]MDP4024086.1 glutathione S-transferase [Methylobacterium sp. NEAU 140]